MTRKLYLLRTALSIISLLTMLSVSLGAVSRLYTSRRHFVQKPFRPYGYYSLVGAHPKGFENFDTIQYWRKEDEQSGPDISERLSGVTADEGVLYRYRTITINRRTFVFTTRVVKSTSYSFTGRFLRTDFLNSELNFDKPVLTGTLTKYRRGKKVAEAQVKLSYFAGT
ncbi:MAG TPA: hypothetical protein VM911_00570 [Pyrinomonadaceae bacterium]|nr:hypothetical protein [Pyrinomonadaceae bacterium]